MAFDCCCWEFSCIPVLWTTVTSELQIKQHTCVCQKQLVWDAWYQNSNLLMLVQLFSTLSVTDVFSILTPGLISYHNQLQNKTVHMFSIFSVIFSLGWQIWFEADGQPDRACHHLYTLHPPVGVHNKEPEGFLHDTMPCVEKSIQGWVVALHPQGIPDDSLQLKKDSQLPVGGSREENITSAWEGWDREVPSQFRWKRLISLWWKNERGAAFECCSNEA